MSKRCIVKCIYPGMRFLFLPTSKRKGGGWVLETGWLYARNLRIRYRERKKKLLSARGGGWGGGKGRFEARIHAMYSGGASVRIARWDGCCMYVHVHVRILVNSGISRVSLDRK